MELIKTEPTTRTLEDVKKDYGQTCAQLGEVNYKEDLFSKTLRKLLEDKQTLLVKLSSLNDEANQLSKPTDATPTPAA